MTAITAARRNARLYLRFLGAGFRSQTIYGFDSALLLFAVVFLNVVDLSLLAVMLTRFEALGGWTMWEVVLLYCMFLAVLGLQYLFTLHLNRIDEFIQDGTLDQMLVRPVSPLLQLVAREFHLRNLFHHFGTGIVGVLIAMAGLGLAWTPERVAILAASLVGGTLLLTGMVLALASLAFWTVRSQVFLFGTAEIQEAVQHYPATVFGQWFVRAMTFLLPLAFVNYYPVMALTGRADEAMHPLLPYASPLVGSAVLAVGVVVWRAGLRRYESTGN
ncbi:ABC transporter permease [Glycomyces artemisiae]|uniref:ABC-2 type transport system permease protein n=1 Tax=Glycomyces artemisiae TaxID=1076443 RepID=A0A2T0UL36_9ACTN|nr:ABC-2 family transporter protein [Glycomyces artemisiae]PRY58630.1 ABC-2 type transport system permease protein [Glycomyces artemisiae]